MGERKNLLTPLIVTHYSPKSSYGELAPPSCGIIEQLFESFDSYLCELSTNVVSKPILIYNYPSGTDGGNPYQYKRNLRSFSNKNGIKLFVIPNCGLRRAILYGLTKVETPYVAFIEHDWEFIKDIKTNLLLNIMENNGHVNYIRFNKGENKEDYYDTIVNEDDSKPISLCRVSSYSNNPHIARLSIYKEWIKASRPSLSHIYRVLRLTEPKLTLGYMKYVVKEKYINNRVQVSGYDDVEAVLDMKYRFKIQKIGFDQAHSQMGIYLYGQKGAGPFVQHLGRED